MDHNGPKQTAGAGGPDGFVAYHTRFAEMTRPPLHLDRPHGRAPDATKRLARDKRFAELSAAQAVRGHGSAGPRSPLLAGHQAGIRVDPSLDAPDAELAETFRNSTSRRLFATSGVDARIGSSAPWRRRAPGQRERKCCLPVPLQHPSMRRAGARAIDGGHLVRAVRRPLWCVRGRCAGARRPSSAAPVRGESRSTRRRRPSSETSRVRRRPDCAGRPGDETPRSPCC